MDRKIRILFAGSTEQSLSDFAASLNFETDFSLVGQTCDGYELIDLIVKTNPDAVVMGLVLARLDGLGVLARIQQLSVKPKVLVCSSYGNMIELAASMGADSFVLKPYSPQNLSNRIRQMVSAEQSKPISLRNTGVLHFQSQVTVALMDLGVPTHILGFKYLRKAIVYALYDPKYLEGITKTLYPTVAKNFESTACRVERAIRHAIEIAWDRCDENMLNKYFGWNKFYETNKPTNREFIAAVCEHIRLMNEQSLGA